MGPLTYTTACLQNPGDILYVPRDWAHATVNVQESIGVAVEFSGKPFAFGA